MKTRLLVILIFALTIAKSQETTDHETNKAISYYKHSIGMSAFMVTNLMPDPADYYLLTYGYQFSEKDRVIVEFNTWKFSEPLGTYENSDEPYPGYVREFGIGFGYQRFIWKGLFASVQATPFLKYYLDNGSNKIQNGFKIYMQFAVGYRFELFKNRLYLEPAWALKYWPVDTNFPEPFADIEDGAPNYIFEPSLNIGFKF